MDNSRDLRVLIDSRTPIVILQTIEEERGERIVAGIAEGMDLPLFVWTATQGLSRRGLQGAIYGSQDPSAALSNIGASSIDAIYLLKDFHRYLGNPLVIRKLQDISAEFRKRRRSIIILAPGADLPPELETYAAVIHLELPTLEELRDLVARVIRTETARQGISSELGPDDIERFAVGLRGLTLYEAERAMTRTILSEIRKTKPLSQTMSEKVNGLRRWADGRTVPAGEA